MKTKKKLFILTFLCFLAQNSYAQSTKEGNIIIEPYYGYPNLGKGLLDFITDEISEEVNTVKVGPMGLRFEYMSAKKIGLGFDFIYNSVTSDFRIDSLNDDETKYGSYQVTAFANRFRLQMRANYHFIQKDQYDAYVGLGAGINIRTIGFDTDYPNFNGGKLSGALFPLSARIALGSRYYLTDNFGINLELGIGGPIVSAGISLKF